MNLFGGMNPLRDLPDNQWLSADLIDFDFDGDEDLYLTGGDGQGRVQNQFFVNTLIQYGDDRLEGGPGNDTIYGGAGNDTIFGGTGGGDSIIGSIIGDVDLDGEVSFSDIGPFINVLQNDAFQFEADVDENGVVNFLDIAPFILLLQNQDVLLLDGNDILVGGSGADEITGGAGDDTFFGFRAAIGDVNLDGQVNFGDIGSFINFFQAGVYRVEADIDGNREVDDPDQTLFIELLSGDQPFLRDGAEDVFTDAEANDTVFVDE